MEYKTSYLGNANYTSLDLAVIINSYNRLSLLKEALPSIYCALGEVYPKAGIYIYDAGSIDNSVEYVLDFAKNHSSIPIILIQSVNNVPPPFSQGCNIAVLVAAESFSNLRWLFFYETDNLIQNKVALQKALALLTAQSQLASVGFTVETYSKAKAEFGCTFPSLLSFVIGQQLSAKLSLNTIAIDQWNVIDNIEWAYADVVYTSPLLVRYEVWKSTDGMDAQNFPFSDCDVDWCWAVEKQGWRNAVLNIKGIIHDNKNIQSTWSGIRTLNYHKARFKLLIKHKGPWIKIVTPLLFIRHIAEASLLLLSFDRNPKTIKSFYQRIKLMKSVFNGYH